MKQSKNEIELSHKAEDLFNIVLNIEEYPKYIPWCTSIEIIKKNPKNITAEMIVNYKFFSTQKFISKVVFDNKKLFIKTKYIEGPLKDLYTIWEFKKLKDNKSKIIFTIEFEFKNFLHQKIAEFFFPLIESKMIDSFLKRADDILD